MPRLSAWLLPISGVERGHVPAPPLDPHLAKEHAARVTLTRRVIR